MSLRPALGRGKNVVQSNIDIMFGNRLPSSSTPLRTGVPFNPMPITTAAAGSKRALHALAKALVARPVQPHGPRFQHHGTMASGGAAAKSVTEVGYGQQPTMCIASPPSVRTGPRACARARTRTHTFTLHVH